MMVPSWHHQSQQSLLVPRKYRAARDVLHTSPLLIPSLLVDRYKSTMGSAPFVVYVTSYSFDCPTNGTGEMGLAYTAIEGHFLRHLLSGHIVRISTDSPSLANTSLSSHERQRQRHHHTATCTKVAVTSTTGPSYIPLSIRTRLVYRASSPT